MNKVNKIFMQTAIALLGILIIVRLAIFGSTNHLTETPMAITQIGTTVIFCILPICISFVFVGRQILKGNYFEA